MTLGRPDHTDAKPGECASRRHERGPSSGHPSACPHGLTSGCTECGRAELPRFGSGPVVLLEPGRRITTPEEAEAVGLTVEARRMREGRL